jgi:hypothetical protein
MVRPEISHPFFVQHSLAQGRITFVVELLFCLGDHLVCGTVIESEMLFSGLIDQMCLVASVLLAEKLAFGFRVVAYSLVAE